MTTDLYARYKNTLAQLHATDNQRTLILPKTGTIFLNHNDYLGLAQEMGTYQAFLQQAYHAPSSSNSRLLGGSQASALAAEARIAAHYQRSTLIFNSGYHANCAILPALLGKHDLIIADKHCHASLLDGAKLSDAKLLRYRHQQYQELEKLLAKHRHHYQQVIILSESVFSMDGSVSNLHQLVWLKKRYQTLLYIDEAHSIGVYGAQGLGIAQAEGLIKDIDIWVAPCAKALAAYGAIVLTDDIIKTYLINRTRAFIYSSALPPLLYDWLAAQVDTLASLTPQRHRLYQHITDFHQALNLPPPTAPYPSPIIGLLIGDNATTLEIATDLAQQGILVSAIRHPTVAHHTARLRISLHAGLSQAQLTLAANAIARTLHAHNLPAKLASVP